MATDPLIDREPVALGVGGLAGVIDAFLVLVAAFDWADITAAQTTAIIVFVTALSAMVGSLVRSHVWSPASVAALTG